MAKLYFRYSAMNAGNISTIAFIAGGALLFKTPLLILAGLALLLVAGGSAGYLLRRVQARRLPPPAV